MSSGARPCLPSSGEMHSAATSPGIVPLMSSLDEKMPALHGDARPSRKPVSTSMIRSAVENSPAIDSGTIRTAAAPSLKRRCARRLERKSSSSFSWIGLYAQVHCSRTMTSAALFVRRRTRPRTRPENARRAAVVGHFLRRRDELEPFSRGHLTREIGQHIDVRRDVVGDAEKADLVRGQHDRKGVDQRAAPILRRVRAGYQLLRRIRIEVRAPRRRS